MNCKAAILEKLFIFFLLWGTAIPSLPQKLNENRTQYFKERKLVIIFPSFSLKDSSFFKEIKVNLQKNFRIAFNTYWDLSNSVIYEAWDEKGLSLDWYKKIKEIHGDAIFLEYGSLGGPNGKGAYGLVFPDPKPLLNGIPLMVLGNDTTLVNIIEECRFLRLGVMYGDLYNRHKLGTKFVLVRKRYTMNKWEVRLIAKVKRKSPDAIIELDDHLLLEALMTRDPRCIYLNRSRLVNAEDGTIVTLE